MTGRDHHLFPLVRGTLYTPYSTALRMGRFGYQNSAQKQLGIHYNNLQDYLEGLQKAVRTPYKQFTRLGLDDANGQPIQINDHVLQIENEYYSLVRPKQVPKEGETPSQALQNRGIGYVELRAVDVNPYSAIGINEDTAGFLEVVALYCLLQDSPALLDAEQEIIDQNQAEVVNRGRAYNAAIMENGQRYMIEDWCNLHLQRMQPLAQLLDQAYETNLYNNAMQAMQIRVDEVDATLSALIVGDIRSHSSMWQFGQHLAHQHSNLYESHRLSKETLKYFNELSQKSLQQQQQLEQDNTISFTEYLAQYR